MQFSFAAIVNKVHFSITLCFYNLYKKYIFKKPVFADNINEIKGNLTILKVSTNPWLYFFYFFLTQVNLKK